MINASWYDSRNLQLRVDFDRRLKLEFHGSKVTTDAGLLAYRRDYSCMA